MAVPAQELQVVRVKSNAGIMDVIRSKVDLVMHNLPYVINASLQTPLTQMASLGRISIAAVMPCL